jgi:hypothetical protein
MAVVLWLGGLQDSSQDSSAVAKCRAFRLSLASRLSGPDRQVVIGLFFVLPPMMLARVAAS